jgi:hypothetical protein
MALLTAPPEMGVQTPPYAVVDLAKGHPWVLKAEVVGPASQVAVGLAYQRGDRFVAVPNVGQLPLGPGPGAGATL